MLHCSHSCYVWTKKIRHARTGKEVHCLEEVLSEDRRLCVVCYEEYQKEAG